MDFNLVNTPYPISTKHLGRSNSFSRPIEDQGRLGQLEELITLPKGGHMAQIKPTWANDSQSEGLSRSYQKNSLPQEGVVYRFYQELMPPFVSWGKRVGLSGANTENMKPKPQKAERRGREKCRPPSQHPWNHWLFSLPELVILPCDEVFSHIQCKESLWRRTNLQCTSDSPEE